MYKSRDAIELDHNEDGTYRGLSHMLCNRRAGGLKAAAIAGRRPRDRKCTICGAPYKASYPNQTCCGDRSCITMLRKLRRL
jgi:hypothetical protein